MSFEAPLLLVGLLLVPLLVWAYLSYERRSQAAREAFVSTPLLAAVAPHRPGWRRHVPVLLLLLAVTTLVLALARPQTTRAVPIEQASIVVVTDRSGSMLAEDVRPNRLVAAREAAQTFVDNVPNDVRVGAIAFNQAPSVIASPTRNHVAVRAALDQVDAAGSTATGDALAAALRLLPPATPGSIDGDDEAPPAAVVLLSDGKSVRGRDVLEVAEEAKAAAVPVYTVALGTPTGTIVGTDGVTRDVPPDRETLEEVAEITGGESFAIDDAERLRQVYERLGSDLATEEEDVEITNAFAGGALLLMLLAVLASIRWFGRIL